MITRLGVVMIPLLVVSLAAPAHAAGPRGGAAGPSPGGPPSTGGSTSSNSGGAVRGLERAEGVASPQGQKGIENAEQRIDEKGNARNPNTETKEDTDTTKSKPGRK